jgi:tetratricopeptide (TPR) repeat protein
LYHSLKLYNSARKELLNASSTDPDKSWNDAYFNMVSGCIENDLVKQISFFRKAVELDPKFQLAQWNLAKSIENKLRSENRLSSDYIDLCIEEYDKVLQLNQGNITAHYSKGILFWIKKDYDNAIKQISSGIEVKAIKQQTYIGHLYNGLSRVYLSRVLEQIKSDKRKKIKPQYFEREDFKKAYSSFLKAVDSHPSVGAYTFAVDKYENYNVDYDYIDMTFLERFEEYYKASIDMFSSVPEKKHELEAYVRNDYANACLNYFHRFGIRKYIDIAVVEYKKSLEIKPDFAAVYFNLDNAYLWLGQYELAKSNIYNGIKYAAGWVDLEGSFFYTNSNLEKVSNDNLNNVTNKIKETEIADSKIRSSSLKGVGSSEAEFESKAVSGTSGNIRQEQFQPGTKLMANSTLSKLIIEKDEIETDLSKIREINEKGLASLFKNTSFSAFAVNEKFELEQIKQIFGTKHLQNKLDVYDLFVLNICADHAKNQGKPEILEGICNIMNEISESNFEANKKLFELNPDRDDLKKEIKSVFNSWLIDDKSNYAALKWVIEYYGNIFTTEEKLLKINEAITNLRAFKKTDDKYIKPYLDFKLFLAEALPLDDSDVIISIYNEIIEDGGKHIKYFNSYVNFLLDINKSEEAIAILRRFENEINEKDKLHQKLGDIYLELNDENEALKHYKAAYDIDGNFNNLEKLLQLSAKRENLPHFDSVLKKLKKVSEKSINDLDANKIGIILFDNKRYDKAIVFYELAIEKNPDQVVYFENCGLAYERLNQKENAIQVYEKGLKTVKEKHTLFNILGILNYNIEKYEEAIHYYNLAIDLEPRAVYYKNLGLVYQIQSKLPQAERAYSLGLNIAPDKERHIFLNLIGIINYRSGDHIKALNNYQKAIKLSPIPVYFENQGLAFTALNEVEKAIDSYQKGIEKSPEGARHKLYFQIGLLYYDSAKFKQAIKYFQEAIYENESAAYVESLGSAFLNLNQKEKALQEYEKAQLLYPLGQKHTVLFNMGYLYFMDQEYLKAIPCFIKSINDKPDPLYYNYLGRSHIEVGEIEEAEAAYMEGLKFNNPEINHGLEFGLGLVQFAKGNPDQAIVYYTKAIEASSLANYHAFRANAYVQKGDFDAAMKDYDLALAKSTTEEYTAEILQAKKIAQKHIPINN